MSQYAVGDQVVYRKVKASTHPGPRARDIYPAALGEDYLYEVDKYWVVSAVLPDGNIEVTTRTGKTHQISSSDRNLRKAHLIEKFRYRDRFPQLATA